MDRIPECVRSVFHNWSTEFADTVWPRFQTLLMAAILCVGRHTVCRLLRVAGALADAHWGSYHRVLSRRRWSSANLARMLAAQIIERLVPRGPIPVCGDDTVTQHPGRKVYGKAQHRDAVRSSHSHTVWRWGHKWVVLAILVELPGTNRPWALPILVALYRSAEDNQQQGRRHKTPCDLMRQLLCVLLRWFPQRRFVFSGDGGYGTHALARFAARHPRLSLVSKFYKAANLYELPPQRQPGTNGRPRVKGRKLAAPQDVVAQTRRRQRLEVAWYGGGRRRVAVVTGTGHWYKTGQPLVPVRWVFVEDLTGTHRAEYFFTTNLELTPSEIIAAYSARWAIEVTFEEAREHVGLDSTRGRCEQTILRAEPCLLVLYTVVVLWFSGLPAAHRAAGVVSWIGSTKRMLTFSDAITLVRRGIWQHWVFQSPRHASILQKLKPREKHALIELLTQAM